MRIARAPRGACESRSRRRGAACRLSERTARIRRPRGARDGALERAFTPQFAAPWRPDPGNRPQVAAYRSKADLLLYGGAAGGGKTDLLIGLALRSTSAR